MQKRVMWMAVLLVVLLLGACSQKTGQQDVEETDEPKEEQPKEEETDKVEKEEPDEKEEKKEPEFKNTYPLTGEKTNDEVDHRIVTVMVNNHSYARPQTGLNEADMVYEVLAEGPITRFLAFYHSKQPAVLGPVRSAREYYINIAKGYNALYVYHGAAQYIEDRLQQGWIDHLNGMYYDNDRKLFKRESFRRAPHNSYLLFDSVYEKAEKRGYEVKKDHKPLPFLTEEEVKTISGDDAQTISITYSTTPQETVTFKYNAETEKYTRFNDGVKTADLNSKEPTTVDNVFIVETGHKVIDSKLRRSIDLKSGGKGYLIQKGKVQNVTWKNVDGRILPFKDGKEVGFVPGKTWVNIVPENPGINQSVSLTSPQ